jgi:hypothetical protein
MSVKRRKQENVECRGKEEKIKIRARTGGRNGE